ncbi:MAG: hypothetical protein AUK35_10325 [Zetaproteobacteria bacterium CG2_30_46_52]|nr:MAG: hypothetical protein AUK35_10325 [Zetaproteobacteria bacterium CG2_30_46_52]
MTRANNISIDDFQGKKFADLRVLYPDELQRMRENVELLSVKANDPVIVEGQEGDYLYFVKSGQLRVNKYHAGLIYEVAAINQGDIFGEASVLYHSVAGAEVRAMDDTELYLVPADIIYEILASNEKFLRAITQTAERRSAASALAVNPAFSSLPMAVREVVLFNCKMVSIEKDEVVIKQGDYEPLYVFIILAGELRVEIKVGDDDRAPIEVARLVSGDEVGEISVVTGHPHIATVTACKATRVIAIKSSAIMAWSDRHSDFAYALYGQVYRKLHDTRTALISVIEDKQARDLTINQLPLLQAFKDSHEF